MRFNKNRKTANIHENLKTHPLHNKNIYLAGAVDDPSLPDRGAGWRADVSQIMWLIGAIPLDPTNESFKAEDLEKLEDIDNRRKLIEEENYDEVSDIMSKVVDIDLDAVLKSTMILCKLDFRYKHCGTYHEIFFAKAHNIPVIIWCEQGKKAIPHWLFGVFNHQFFFSSIEEVEQFLTNYK